MKTLPISFIQTKFINPKNILKSIFWYFLRSFQINNIHKHKHIFIYHENLEEINNLDIPKEIRLTSKIDNETLILIYKFNLKLIIKNLKNIRRVRLIDKEFFLTSEASTRFRMYYFDFCSVSERNKYKMLSIENFYSLKKSLLETPVALLGTGPSFTEAKKVFVENKYNIISCNSSIYDDELWHGDCKILCFADPVFHFGTSKEANRFKNAVINRFENKKFYIVCPIFAVPILINNWGIDCKFVIGIDSLNSNGNNNILTSKNTSNVLTEFMLPLGSLIGKEIYFGGFDGRDKEEKEFWQYSHKTHQTLDEHRIQHPSFFSDRSMSKYYKQHINILEKQINDLEKQNYKIINITKSFIPALKKRGIDE